MEENNHPSSPTQDIMRVLLRAFKFWGCATQPWITAMSSMMCKATRSAISAYEVVDCGNIKCIFFPNRAESVPHLKEQVAVFQGCGRGSLSCFVSPRAAKPCDKAGLAH